MSRAKGNRAAGWVADYLRPWWPNAEKTPNSIPGIDIQGTPSVCWEVKTSPTWRAAWLDQVHGYCRDGEVGIIAYLPPGTGARTVGGALAVMRMDDMMRLLTEAGYAPRPGGGP